MNKYDRRHLANVKRYQAQVESIYKIAAEESARLAAGQTAPDDAIFSFEDSPRLQAAMDKLQQQMAAHLDLTITDGINEEWALSNAKNDALVNALLGEEARQARYYRTNTEARDAFIARKEGGLALSDRVWRYTDQFKAEIEMGIDCGLREGLDAPQMARQLKQYLQHPDKLFRRVRDEHGNLRLSKAAAAYHPGQGVYRSSYKNARRLAATETNMAYRTADYERWQQLDFIVGIEVQLSNNHTCLDRKGKPKPFYDICDELKGKYPKEFKFTGWHPHCRCIATTILMTDAEMKARREARRNGEQPPVDSVNEVKQLPDNFKQWVEDNEERIARAKSQPYFLRDNARVISQRKGDAASQATPRSRNQILQAAGVRHAQRTDADIRRLQDYADEHKYGKEFVNHVHEMETHFGKTRVKRMPVGLADEQHANPNYKPNSPTSINCQTCAPTYVLRTRGFDVYAKARTPNSVSEWIAESHSFDIWENTDGSKAVPTLYADWLKQKGYRTMTPKRYKEFYEEHTKEQGIYVVTIGWKNGGGHATIIQRFADGTLKYIEPQRYEKAKGIKRDISELCNGGKRIIPKFSKRGIMRVDDKVLKRYCTDSTTGKQYDIWSIFEVY